MEEDSLEKNNDEYPWYGETLLTMRERHERDTKSLYETDGIDIEREQLRLSVEYTKWEYERRQLMSRRAKHLLSNDSCKAHALLVQIESEEDRFLERRKKLGERMMGYHLHKESMEEGHKIEKELLGKKLGLPYPPTYSDVEVLKEKQRKEREKLWEEAGAEVERMGIRLNFRYTKWSEERRGLNKMRAASWIRERCLEKERSYQDQICDEEGRFQKLHVDLDEAQTKYRLKKEAMEEMQKLEWACLGELK